jgi:hypothetical protein
MYAVSVIGFAAIDIITTYIIIFTFGIHDLVIIGIAAVANKYRSLPIASPRYCSHFEWLTFFVLRAVSVLLLAGFVYLSPKRRRKYNLISWNISRNSLKIFASNSGFMFGFVLLLFFFLSFVTAQHCVQHVQIH